jgi:hypothetical protein
MNLKVTGKRTFGIGETAFNQTEWTQWDSGLYDVVWCPNSKPGDATAKNERVLMFWGHDENIPNTQRVLVCMPFPGFAVATEPEQSPISKIERIPLETGISGDVLLKAIAIAQDPKLALELL